MMKKLVCLVLAILMITSSTAPALADNSNPTEYSGAFNSTDWVYTDRFDSSDSLLCGVTEDGRIKTSDSSNYTVTSAAEYDLGTDFRLDFDYIVANNYNCNESQYVAVKVGDLEIRISNLLKDGESEDSDWITNKRPYGTIVSVYWAGSIVKSSPEYRFSKLTLGYGVRVDNGNITVTRSLAGHEKALVRISADEFANVGGNTAFEGVRLEVYSAEKWKTVYFSNLSVTQNIGTDDYEDMSHFLAATRNHGDVNEDNAISPTDVLTMSLRVLNMTTLDDVQELIADTDRDGDVTSADLLTVVQNHLGLSEPQAVKAISLTFDDGPSTDITAAMIEILAQYDAKSTFFIIGNRVKDSNKHMLSEIISAGHELGNHSYSHNTNMPSLTVEEIRQEFELTQQIIYENTGVTATLFRAPGVTYNDSVVNNIDALFINGKAVGLGNTATERVEVIRSTAANGMLYLLHDYTGNTESVTAIQEIVPWLVEQGYALVSASDLIRLNAPAMAQENHLATW